MLVDGGVVWENDRGDGKSLVRGDAVVINFRRVTCSRRRGSHRLQKYQTNEVVY
jgi:hypothetical protein